MNGRRTSVVGFALGACVLFGATSAAAAPPQVTVYLGGYAPQNQAGQPVRPGQPSGTSAINALQAQTAFVQGAAYERYLEYVTALNYQSSRAAATDPQYFSNGASTLTIPTSGPGSAYFTNGAEATRVPTATGSIPPSGALGPAGAPPPPPSFAPPGAPPGPTAPPGVADGNGPAAAAPPPPPPPPPGAGSASVPTPLPAPPAAVPSSPPLPSSPPPADPRAPAPEVAAMSFEEWLQSMGGEAADENEPPPPAGLPAGAPVMEAALIAAPAAAELDVRHRAGALSVRREKAREPITSPGGPSNLVAALVGTFAAGLALGALAMRRLPRRTL